MPTYGFTKTAKTRNNDTITEIDEERDLLSPGNPAELESND